MKEKDHQLLWNYVDGNCTSDEEQKLNRELLNQSPWQEELEQKMLLHEIMNGIEPKHTSMRFVKTIMENLPDLRTRIVIPPLVPKEWIRNFVAAFALFVLSLVIVSWGNSSLTGSGNIVHEAGAQFSSLFLGISTKSWSLLFALTVGPLILTGLDHWLKTGKLQKRLK